MSGYIGTQPVPQATQTRQTFTATASQTSFPTGGYQAGYLDVFLNGVKLVDGTDYTATNGSDVVLTTGAASGDTLEVVAYTAFEVLNQNFTGGLAVDNNGATVITADRQTSDGEIIALQKNGVTEGTIGVAAGDNIYIGSTSAGHSGIGFGSNELTPMVPAGTNSDGVVNLGYPTRRFNSLYLSGGVYLGGTGSANKLDDYEEGTWTPSYDCATTSPTITYDSGERSASYIKIGKMVFIQGTIRTDAVSGGSGGLQLTGLPFSARASGSERCGGFSVSGYQSGFGVSHPTGGYINNGVDYFVIMSNDGVTTSTGLDNTDLGTGANANFMMFNGQYETD